MLPGIVFAGFAVTAVGQVPATVVKITNLDSSTGTPYLEIENTGSKPIATVVFQFASTKGTTWTSYNEPIRPGATAAVMTSEGLHFDKLAAELQISEVIFSDQTHIGRVIDSATQHDPLEDIFEFRQGEADGFASWLKVVTQMPSDPHAFMRAFKAKAMSTTEPTAGFSHYNSATQTIDGGMKAMAARVAADIARGRHYSIGPDDPLNGVHDEASAKAALLAWIKSRANQTKINATDAGEASK